MRLLARSRGPRPRGTAHALRSAYNHFTLVEPFPNGTLYFKRVVDRPVCVYVVRDRLFVLASELRAFSMTPIGGQRFHLARGSCFLSPGDYVDDDTCEPIDAWSEAKAWEAFRLADAPSLDRRERRTIEHIDALLDRREPGAPADDPIEAAVHACLASIECPCPSGARRPKTPAESAPAGRADGADNEVGWGFRGSIDVSRRSHAAGWAARNRDSTTVSVFVNGGKVGEASGSGERPDVMAAGFARHSAWSFVFAKALGADDRAAFRFPDGSPLRLKTGAHAPCLGSTRALRSTYNGFLLAERADGGLCFARETERPVCVYVVDTKLFVLASPMHAFLIEPVAPDAVRLRSVETELFYSLGSFVDDDTCAPEANRAKAQAWELFELVDPPRLGGSEEARIAAIDQALLRQDDAEPLHGESDVHRAWMLVALTTKQRAPAVRPAERPRRVALCAIARNEAPYLVEWAAYHLAAGFDAIFIYDNESTDGGVAELAKAGLDRVTVKPWPSVNGSAQVAAYDDFFTGAAAAFDWVLILDIDEFLVLKTDRDVKDFLMRFPDADGIAVNWRIFGSSERKTWAPGLVVERFARASPADFGPNANVKTFFRPESVSRAATHSPHFLDGSVFLDQSRRTVQPTAPADTLLLDINHDSAQINHYFTKSYGEFATKRSRGKADHEEGHPGKYRPMEEFFAYDRNEEEDRAILRTDAFHGMKRRLDRRRMDLLAGDPILPGAASRARTLLDTSS